MGNSCIFVMSAGVLQSMLFFVCATYLSFFLMAAMYDDLSCDGGRACVLYLSFFMAAMYDNLSWDGGKACVLYLSIFLMTAMYNDLCRNDGRACVLFL